MAQIKTRGLENFSVDDQKIRARNNNYIVARNAANSANVDILKVNASDVIEFASFPQKSGTPSNANDLANKSYVDAQVAASSPLKDPKDSVRALQDSNLALTGGASLSVDSVSLANGDRIALVGQTAGAENGIYTVSGIGSAYSLTRATDADTSAEVTAGMHFFVSEGTVYSNQVWYLNTDDPITLDTTSLTFAVYGLYQAGAGLALSGNTINVAAADASITVNANDIQVARDAAGAVGLSGSGIIVNYDSATLKIATNNLTGPSWYKENLTLNGTDISNQYKDLARAIQANSLILWVDGVMQVEGTDYTLSGSPTRITFAGDLATGGNSALVNGDVLHCQYTSLA